MLLGTQNTAGPTREAWIVQLRREVGVRIAPGFSTEVAAFFKRCSDLGFGLRRIEIGGYPDFAYAASDNVLARLPLRLDEHQLDSRLAIARNDDLLSALGCGDEFGEMSLSVMDVDFHSVC